MTITKKQRAEVVELYRCAADLLLNSDSIFPVLDAEIWLGRTEPDATRKIRYSISSLPCQDEGLLLELAQRVEDGEWP